MPTPDLPERRATPAAPGIRADEYWLRSFTPSPVKRRMRARVRLDGSRLTVRYVLEGALDDLLLPWPEPVQERRDELWRSTCFEAFLAAPGSRAYHEINLAPAGHWACYAFSAPREGLRPEPALAALDWKTHRVPGHYAIRFTLELDRIWWNAREGLELGISAILLRQDGAREFWSLTHPGPTPDFHARAGFLLRLP